MTESKHIFVRKYLKGLDGAFTLNCENCGIDISKESEKCYPKKKKKI